VDRRAARAAELLAAWERRLKMAKTKVGKYRRKVNYYGAVAARRQG
jgi:ABC-type Fe3+-hydroxamate transport system substrate-binding protein